jgi:hypothetical protein
MILALSFVITGSIAIASAQVDSDAVFKINAPFSFNVRGKNLPAGEYVIRTTDTSGDSTTMEISSTSAKRARAIFSTESIDVNEAPKESNVIFGKVQGKYYLSEIWEANNPKGSQVEEPDLKRLERAAIRKEKEVVHAEMLGKATAAHAKHTY